MTMTITTMKQQQQRQFSNSFRGRPWSASAGKFLLLGFVLAVASPTTTTAFLTTSTTRISASTRRSNENDAVRQRITTRLFSNSAVDDTAKTMSPNANASNDQQPEDELLLLQDCICVVTGASRGIGKGIALELGAQGATVYVTGTSSSGNSDSDSGNNDNDNPEPGTVEETAQEITALGGRGVPVICNHANDKDVKALFQTIQREHGRLDILINNAFRLPAGGVEQLYKKFWEFDDPADIWDTIHTVGLRSHFMASSYAVPLMMNNDNNPPRKHLPRPLIGMISSFGGLCYTFNTAYGVGKAGVDRLAKDMAVELRQHDIAVVSFWPGVVNTERTQYAVKTGEWDEYVGLPLDNAETPRLSGRAVVNVALDENNLAEKSGTYQVVAELAEEYGFTDVGGNVPPSIRSLQFLIPTYGLDEETRKKLPRDFQKYIPDWKLPFWVMAQGQPPAQD